MTSRRILFFSMTHILALAIGFAAGIYTLPILIAPDSPSSEEITAVAESAEYSATFQRGLAGSDALHWGEGEVFISADSISHKGKLSPGPDYKLYLSPQFVETEDSFNRLKTQMALVGDVKTFDGFLVSVPPGLNPSDYNSVIVWCESFGEFITSAKYK